MQVTDPRRFGRVAVGVHETTGAQQRPAEVARDDQRDVAQAAAAQHCQHRPAGGAGRLAVVGHAERGDLAIEAKPHIALDVIGQVFGDIAGVEDHR